MGNLKGALFFVLCVIMAICVWGVNVIYVDNALPMILSNFFNVFVSVTMGGFNPTWWVQLFCTLERLSPLFIVVFGGIGWAVEAYLYGRGDYSQSVSRYG